MTRKSIGFLCAAAVCAATISVTISSCDSNSNPATPGAGGRNNGGKRPQVLDAESRRTIGSTEEPSGETSLEYVDGDLAAYGLNNADQDGFVWSFDEPINVWHAVTDVIFPPDGSGEMKYSAQDEEGNIEAEFNISRPGEGYDVRPTFTSNPDGGYASYDALVYQDGNLAGSAERIDISTPVTLIPNCDINIFQGAAFEWEVYNFNSQCLWKLKLPRGCCNVRFLLPDGTVIEGDALTLRERNDAGVYVYTLTRRVVFTGNLPNTAGGAASYVVRASSGYNTAN